MHTPKPWLTHRLLVARRRLTKRAASELRASVAWMFKRSEAN